MKSEECDRVPLSTAPAVATPYLSGLEHLADLLARHDWLLKRELARGQAHKPADILGFAAITEQEVHHLLNLQPGDETETSAQIDAIEAAIRRIEQQIAARVSQSEVHGIRLPLVALTKRFSLTSHELDLLLVCLAVELDRRYERIYGFLHDDMSRRLPSPGLALSLNCGSRVEQLSARALLSSRAPLRRYRLVDVQEEGVATPWLSRAMRIDERIIAFILGDDAFDSRLARHLSRAENEPPLIGAGKHQRHADELLEKLSHEESPWKGHATHLIYLHGARDAGAEAVVSTTAHKVDLPLLVLDCESLSDADETPETLLFLAFREAMLSGSALFLRDVDRLLEATSGASHLRSLLRYAADMSIVVFASGECAWHWPTPTHPVELHSIQLRGAGPMEQVETWQALSRGKVPDSELHRLVSLHPLPFSSINSAWRVAQRLALNGGTNAPPAAEHLRAACRALAVVPENSLARRIDPAHDWTDLVLPATQRDQLSALCSQARYGSIVYGQWGFDRKLSLGRSLNALFCGPPGTGKTLAAEVIARELGVALLKIDLSQVVNKYIGETEKNLRQLFDQAASANAILFFDEADALLGKRSEVKDAHDRYANTQTAYLLQKMEEYTGITILSTNLRQNLDEAFTRRMRFIIEFPFPEDEDRKLIWQSVFPREVPLAADVDFAALARQFRLSGGSIRNVALSAAFLAAEQGEPLSMRHLMRATRNEFQKMGRLVNDEDYRLARRT